MGDAAMTATDRPRPRVSLPGGGFERGVRLFSTLLITAVGVGLILGPGLPAEETIELRTARIGGGVGLLVLLAVRELLALRGRRG